MLCVVPTGRTPMSIATVSPDAVTEQPRSGEIDVAFSGRFGLGIDRWVYLPFEVPRGVRRIRVAISHDSFALCGIARNVLDLGILGPAGHGIGNATGFRGWSGGARDGFVISASDATPGYLAGPIEPGVWALALGPVVLNPCGMAWEARVTMECGEEPGDAGAGGASTSPPAHVRGAGWYRGDLHLHTVHSDGQYEVSQLITVAHAGGLDFIVSTDHNTCSANGAWPAFRADPLLVIPGEEVTTRHGHWLPGGPPGPGRAGRRR